MFDRILGRQDHKRIRQRVRDSLDGHVPFGHRLKQGGLRLWRGAVDFVGEDDVCEDRPRLPFEQ